MLKQYRKCQHKNWELPVDKVKPGKRNGFRQFSANIDLYFPQPAENFAHSFQYCRFLTVEGLIFESVSIITLGSARFL